MRISDVLSAIRITAVAGLTCALFSNSLAAAQTSDAPDEDVLNLNVMVQGTLDGESTAGVGIVFGLEAERIFIVTANHVVRRGKNDATNLRVLFRSRQQAPVEARLAPQSDSNLDLAVLIVDDARKRGLAICDFVTDRLGDPDSLTKGDEVYPVGFPNGVGWAVPVTAERFVEARGDLLTFQSLFIARGYSGGALIAGDGTVVGMIQKDQPPFGSAIHIRKVLDVLSRWRHPVGLHEARAAHLAAANGDMARLRRLLTGGGCSVAQTRDEDGWTPLLWAANEGQAAAVALLLTFGANPNEATPDGHTALHLAAGSSGVSYAEVIARLLAAGADVNRATDDASTPLDVAAANAPEHVQRLLAAGAKVNRADASGSSALFAAVASHRVTALDSLLAAKANPNVRSKQGESPLHMAVTEGKNSPSSWRPAETAQIVRALLNAKADPNWSNERYPPPLLAMLENIRTEVRRYPHEGFWPPPFVAAVERHAIEIVRSLLQAGANPNGSWTDGRGERHFPLEPVVGDASFSPNNPWDRTRAELARVLLAAGADPRRPEIGAITAFAVRTGDGLLLKAVLARGVDVKLAKWSEDQPLLVAVTGRNVDAARQLLDAGADVNTRDVFGHSVLTKARENKDEAMVKLLLARGGRE
jgi:ankyrin repeat protein